VASIDFTIETAMSEVRIEFPDGEPLAASATLERVSGTGCVSQLPNGPWLVGPGQYRLSLSVSEAGPVCIAYGWGYSWTLGYYWTCVAWGNPTARGAVSLRSLPDCDGNCVIDEVDIAVGGSEDADASGVPDCCEQDLGCLPCRSPIAQIYTPRHEPFGAGSPLLFSVADVLPSEGEVLVRVDARADLDGAPEFVDVRLDGQLVGTLWANGGDECGLTPSPQFVLVPATTFNQFVEDGMLTLSLECSPSVSVASCPSSYAKSSISYQLAFDDCNKNGTPDPCDLASGQEEDANVNGIPDCCEGEGSCGSCLGDLDGSGTVDGVDIAVLLAAWGQTGVGSAADLDPNGLVNGGDLAILLGSWGACP